MFLTAVVTVVVVAVVAVVMTVVNGVDVLCEGSQTTMSAVTDTLDGVTVVAAFQNSSSTTTHFVTASHAGPVAILSVNGAAYCVGVSGNLLMLSSLFIWSIKG